jgi:hypothetical protein
MMAAQPVLHFVGRRPAQTSPIHGYGVKMTAFSIVKIHLLILSMVLVLVVVAALGQLLNITSQQGTRQCPVQTHVVFKSVSLVLM